MTLALVLAVALSGAPAVAPRVPSASTPAVATAPDTRTDAQVQDQVQTLLMTIDTPITEAHWKALGERAVPMLEQITGDEAKLPSRRAKAIEGMVAIKPANLEQKLTALAQNPKGVDLVRWTAIRSLGRVVEPTKLVQLLNPALQDSDFRVRAVAAETLSRHAPAQACTAIRAKAAGDLPHQAAFTNALNRCDSAKAR